MTSFILPENYINNLEALLRKNRFCTASSAIPPTNKLVAPAPSATTSMAKSLREYSIPAVANMLIEPAVKSGNETFELRTSLITMVQANPLCGLPSEDANVHL
jgi:hypothetical protein